MSRISYIEEKTEQQNKELEQQSKMYNLRLKMMIMVIIVLVLALLVLLALPMTANYWYYTNTSEAIYKGFIENETEQYPIIEINGTEYIAKKSQAVRDISYIGNTVKIKYPYESITDSAGGAYADFIIDWSNILIK